MTAGAAGSRPFGYYVHHHGAGHGVHALALARVVGSRLVGLGSGPEPPGWSNEWVTLPRDDSPGPEGDPTRDGAWHWLPGAHGGFMDRMRAIAGWVDRADPAVLVSDVSVEVSILAALLGVASVPVLLHGQRTDAPHRLAFDTAEAIVAPWPVAHAEPWQKPWADKTHHLGLLSRFDGRRDLGTKPSTTASGTSGSATATAAASSSLQGLDDPLARGPIHDGAAVRHVLLILPSGEHGIEASMVEAAADATRASGWCWNVAGDLAGGRPGSTGTASSIVRWCGRVDDLWPLLSIATVVVSGAGAGSVADIAAARRPAVLLPQLRPFDEQAALARHLSRTAPVTVTDRWPAADQWPHVLVSTAALPGRRWADLHDRHAADRFAEVLSDLH